MNFILLQIALLFLIALWTFLSTKSKPGTIIVLLMMGAVIFGGDKLKAEYNKSQILPGNEVVYRGKIFTITSMTTNSKTNYKAVELSNSIIKLKDVPADSVKNEYRPFWK